MADLTPEDVMALDVDTFLGLVNRDMRLSDDPARRSPNDQALRDSLRHPTVAQRLYDTLLGMHKSVEAQLAAKKEDHAVYKAECQQRGEEGREAWLAHQIEYAKWRASSLRFKAGVERVMFEARQLRGRARDDQLGERVRSLEDAILRHRSEVIDPNTVAEPSDFDFQLWAQVGADRLS